MNDAIEVIDDLHFEREVLASEQPYLLVFSALWCAPCKALNPILAQIASEFRGSLRVGTIDIDDSPGVAARYGVRGAPTLLMFRGGREVGRRLGFTNKPNLLALTGLTTPVAATAG
jgi:thioredoxin 1